MKLIDRVCDALAVFAGAYLVVIMFAIVIQATLRTLGYSGSSHIFTFSEYGLLYIAMAGSPWLVRIKGHVFIEMFTALLPKTTAPTFSRVVSFLCIVICVALVWSGIRVLRTNNTLHEVMIETAKTTSLVFIILLGAAMLTAAFRAFGGEELVREFLNSLPGFSRVFWT